jgi:hypothetical protein
MNRSTLSRLEALEAAHAMEGMDISAALRALHALRRLRGTFPTLEGWLAYERQQQAGWRCAPALSAALAHTRQRREAAPTLSRQEREALAWRSTRERLADGPALTPDERARAAWRRDRARHLDAHPDDVRTPLDRELLAEWEHERRAASEAARE